MKKKIADAAKGSLTPELALCLQFPDYVQLMAEEYWEWVMYGMFIGHAITSRCWKIKDIEALTLWLEDQHEAGQEAFREGMKATWCEGLYLEGNK